MPAKMATSSPQTPATVSSGGQLTDQVRADHHLVCRSQSRAGSVSYWFASRSPRDHSRPQFQAAEVKQGDPHADGQPRWPRRRPLNLTVYPICAAASYAPASAPTSSTYRTRESCARRDRPLRGGGRNNQQGSVITETLPDAGFPVRRCAGTIPQLPSNSHESTRERSGTHSARTSSAQPRELRRKFVAGEDHHVRIALVHESVACCPPRQTTHSHVAVARRSVKRSSRTVPRVGSAFGMKLVVDRLPADRDRALVRDRAVSAGTARAHSTVSRHRRMRSEAGTDKRPPRRWSLHAHGEAVLAIRPGSRA